MAKGDKQAHILVINDVPDLLDMFIDLLGDEGYRVTVDRFTLEMTQILARVKEAAPELIVMDYLIGHEEGGWQFLQMLKMDRETRHIPVVICSAAARQIEEIRPHLNEMGVAVVLKPFDIDHLLEVIAKTLAEPDGTPAVSRD